MKRIFDAKKKYEETEIPSELECIVADAIAKSSPKKKKSAAFYTKILAPVAVCAAICIAVGVNGTVHDVPVEADTEISLARAMPEAAKNARMTPMTDVCRPTAGTERMNGEVRGNNASVIYTDEAYISLSCVDEQGIKRYLNFAQTDGKDVSLEDLGIEGYARVTPFYISSYDTVVVLLDGREKEIKISRR